MRRTHTPQHPRRTPRRVRIAGVAVVLLAAALAPVAPAVPGGAAPAVAPATGPAVDFGVIGVAAIEDWGDIELGTPDPADPAVTVRLILGLTGDRVGLEARARAVNDPASPDFGRGGTIAEEGRRFNAPPAHIADVTTWFATRGVTLVADPTGASLRGDAPVAVAAEAFGTTYLQYPIVGLPPEVVVVTPASPPTALAPGLAGRIDRVYGAIGVYDSTDGGILGGTVPGGPMPGPKPIPSTPTPTTAGPADGGTPWRTGTPSDACPDALATEAFGEPVGLSPAQIRTAYGIDALWAAAGRGTGARVAVASVGFHDPADLTTYRTCFGLEGTPVTSHVVGTVLPGVNLETTIDLQRVVSVVPEAARIDLFVGYDADGGTYQPTRQLFEMLSHPLDASLTDGEDPDVVSLSYGYCEGYLEVADPGFAPLRDITEQMLATAAAAGVGVFVASGDYGASGCLDAFDPPDTDPSVWWPSSAAWAVSVGGTNLTLAPDNTIASSGGWNDVRYGNPWASACLGCSSGGGYSAATPRPWFQAGAPGTPGGATRLVPDIAAFADLYPGYLHHQGGTWSHTGGTSAAAPISAAAFALQAVIARAEGRPAAGFVNPLLYDLVRAGDPTGVVRDVVVGTNDAYGPGYEAGPGYDLVTGLGSPRHDRLLAWLRAAAVPAADPGVRFVG